MFARPVAFRFSAGDEGNSALRAADMIEIDTAFFCGLDLRAALRAECEERRSDLLKVDFVTARHRGGPQLGE